MWDFTSDSKGRYGMVDRSFVITDSLSRKGATPNIPSPVTMPAQTMDSPGSGRDTMYCRAAHSCGESYWEGNKILNPINSQFTQPFTATHSLHGRSSPFSCAGSLPQRSHTALALLPCGHSELQPELQSSHSEGRGQNGTVHKVSACMVKTRKE